MKFIQLTDLHLAANGETLYGLDPVARLEACIADLNARHRDAAFAIVTGDLAHAGDEGAYRVLRRLLVSLELPCHLLIGNHDDRRTFQRVFTGAPRDRDGFVQFAIETEAGVLVALDTNDPDHHYGVLCQRRLEWLQGVLDDARSRSVYLFMHHPPFGVRVKRMDAIALRGQRALRRRRLRPRQSSVMSTARWAAAGAASRSPTSLG